MPVAVAICILGELIKNQGNTLAASQEDRVPHNGANASPLTLMVSDDVVPDISARQATPP